MAIGAPEHAAVDILRHEMTSATKPHEKRPAVFAWRSPHSLLIRGRRVDEVIEVLDGQRFGSWWSAGLRIRCRGHRVSARIIETGRYGSHHPVFKAHIEPYERGCLLVGHIGWGTLNLQSMVFAALPVVGLGVTMSMIGTALGRDKLIDWLFVIAFIGVTAMFSHLAWMLGIERLLPASRVVEIEDLDEELRNALGARRY